MSNNGGVVIRVTPPSLDGEPDERRLDALDLDMGQTLSRSGQQSLAEPQVTTATTRIVNRNDSNGAKENEEDTKVDLGQSLTKALKMVREVELSGEKCRLNGVVALFFLLVVLLLTTAQIVHIRHTGEIYVLSELRMEEATRRLHFGLEPNSFSVTLASSELIEDSKHFYPCLPSNKTINNDDIECFEWPQLARLSIERIRGEAEDNSIVCHRLSWQSLHSSFYPLDCFPFDGWLGGGERVDEAELKWPHEGSFNFTPFLTSEQDHVWGRAVRRFFLNTRGVSLSIDNESPLFVGLDDHQGFCLLAKFDDKNYFGSDLPSLQYEVCVGPDLRRLHERSLHDQFWVGHTKQDVQLLHQMFNVPIYQLPEEVSASHSAVDHYLRLMHPRRPRRDTDHVTNSDNNLDKGLLLLVDEWQEHMGDLAWTSSTFPRPEETLQLLKEHDVGLALGLSPFVSTASVSFQEGIERHIFVEEARQVPALTYFKGLHSVAVLDVTRNDTFVWLQERIQRLQQQLGLHKHQLRIVVDPGDPFHLPRPEQFHRALGQRSDFGQLFISTIMELASVVGVTSVSFNPKAPAFVHLSPLRSSWSSLPTLLTKALHLSAISLPFVDLGPIGGVGMVDHDEDVELFIRWWQLATFFPTQHFSKPFNMLESAKLRTSGEKLRELREKLVVPELLRLSTKAVSESRPFIRPLALVFPNDTTALNVSDEFMLGDDILMAPVLDQGIRYRHVYLPALNASSNDSKEDDVVWMSSEGKYLPGGRWQRDVRAGLEEVLYYVRQNKTDLHQLGL